MLVLDTNHLREIALRTHLGELLMQRLKDSGEDTVTTVVSAEEGLRGWLARVAGANDVSEQIPGYRQFASAITLFAKYVLLPWDDEAAEMFKDFRRQGIRIGTADLKIACITLGHDATLLTRNTVDFARVAGLRFENWLD